MTGMITNTVKIEIAEALVSESMAFFGDDSGGFSSRRSKAIEADRTLEERGLGFTALGFGKNHKSGDTEKLAALVADAEAGDSLAFEAAMRYISLRLFQIPEFPTRLAWLACGVLSGQTKRPRIRKATQKGLSARNLAVFAIVDFFKERNVTLEEAYEIVAKALLNKGLNPNNAKTVKKAHLEARRYIAGGLTPHDLAVCVSFPFLPQSLLGPMEKAVTLNGAFKDEDIQGQDS